MEGQIDEEKAEASGRDSDKPKQELEVEKGRNEELLTKLKYLQADFDNYRKRAEKEAREVEERSTRSLVVSLLSAVDELELAAEHSAGERGDKEVMEGIRMVRKNLMSALESAGLKRIEAVGKPFDPEFHEAVEKVQGEGSGKDFVVEEIRAGYTFRGQVIRPSLVKVELAMKAPQEAKGSE